MARKTKEEALETRQKLLDAAGRVFCEKGVTNTSLNDIAEAAGVTRGAIYWHFKNKTDLIEALWQRTDMPADEAFNSDCCCPGADPLGVIRRRAIEMLHQAIADAHTRQVWDILFHKCENVDETLALKGRLRSSRSDCATNVELVFRAAVDAGQLPDSLDIPTAVTGLFCFIEGLIYNSLIDPERINLADDAGRYVDIYLGGLRGAPSVATDDARPALKSVSSPGA